MRPHNHAFGGGAKSRNIIFLTTIAFSWQEDPRGFPKQAKAKGAKLRVDGEQAKTEKT